MEHTQSWLIASCYRDALPMLLEAKLLWDVEVAGEAATGGEAVAGGASTRARQERRSSRATLWDSACRLQQASWRRAGKEQQWVWARTGGEGSDGRRGQLRAFGRCNRWPWGTKAGRVSVSVLGLEVMRRRCGSPQLVVEVCWKVQPAQLPRSSLRPVRRSVGRLASEPVHHSRATDCARCRRDTARPFLSSAFTSTQKLVVMCWDLLAVNAANT